MIYNLGIFFFILAGILLIAQISHIIDRSPYDYKLYWLILAIISGFIGTILVSI